MPSTGGTPGREDLFDNAASQLRYQAYARLQSTAVAFGESLPIPEIVAIGGQSDGKSSLMEALLGFRFNVTSSEMGTRRPLIVQMVHDPSAAEPRCRLQDEAGGDYSDVLPEGSIADAIRDRTEAHLRRLGTPVSPKPIVMRAEYAYCPNLTIIDTPGFILKARQGEAESTPDDILAMVKEQCAPPHRLILFLQQSSVEWASSLWMHVIQEVDPGFTRTVMVASKFDNRLKEFSERWELEKYLSAAGYLPPSVKPFFVALPKDKSHATSAEWRQAIQAVDAGIKRHLRTEIEGQYDEARYGGRIGFGNLKRYLEGELAARYRDAAPATLALLQERAAGAAAALTAAEDRLHRAGDVAALRRAALGHALALAARVDAVMEGFGGADPRRYGATTDEERAGGGGWPVTAGSRRPAPPHAALRLFGGAAFERCLAEFAGIVQGLSFPPVPRDQVANMLLAQRGRGDGAGAAARAAEELARVAARQALAPLLDAVCARLGAIVRRAYDVAAEMESTEGADETADELLRPYVAFHSAMRAAFSEMARGLETAGKELLRAQLATATGHFSAAALLEAVAAGVGGGEAWKEEEGDEEVPKEIQVVGGEILAGQENAGHGAVAVAAAPARPPFATTQMTVPETPSPDVLTTAKAEASAARRAALAAAASRDIDAASPGKGRVAKAARLGPAAVPSRLCKSSAAPNTSGGSYMDVCAAAEALFAAVKASVAAQGPALKAAFLEPLQTRLAAHLCTEMVGKKDDDFMAHFATQGAVAAMEAERDAAARRAEGLARMAAEFSELARAL